MGRKVLSCNRSISCPHLGFRSSIYAIVFVGDTDLDVQFLAGKGCVERRRMGIARGGWFIPAVTLVFAKDFDMAARLTEASETGDTRNRPARKRCKFASLSYGLPDQESPR